MDDFAIGGESLCEALRHLQRLNQLFGASGPIVYGINQLWNSAGNPGALTVLDVGSGSGDINWAVLKWAERNDVKLNVILTDVTEEAEREAALISQGTTRDLCKTGYVRAEERGGRHRDSFAICASFFAGASARSGK